MPQTSRSNPIRFGVFEVDLLTGELWKSGVKVRLQEQPFQLLATLLGRSGEIVTREELRQQIWPNTVVEYESSLTSALSKVRRALDDSPDNPRFIETVPRRGYRFIGELRSPARRPLDSIAVLPLLNLSGDPHQEFFSDGLTDALITELAKISGLKVVSRTSVMAFKGTHLALPAIAEELGVGTLLEGSVQREGDRVRVTAQLIEAAADTHLWAESYDRAITSLLALQSEVARQVARQIRICLTPQESRLLQAPTISNLDAFETYLRGKAQAYQFTPDAIRNALTLYQSALEQDPSSPLANSGVAEVMIRSLVMALLPPREAGPKGLAAARRAIELDPDVAQGHVALGILQHFFEWDWEAAESSYRRAIQLSPNHAEARAHLGLQLTCLGRFEEADEQMLRSLDLDPLNLFLQHLRGVQLLWIGQLEEAVALIEKLVARAPLFQMSHLTLWAAYHALGRMDDSLASARKAWSVVQDDEVVKALDDGHEEGGYEAAMKRAADTLATRARLIYVQPHILSLLYDFAGEKERVFECIERGFEDREHAMSYINRKPFSARVTADPRFEDVLRRMRLPR